MYTEISLFLDASVYKKIVTMVVRKCSVLFFGLAPSADQLRQQRDFLKLSHPAGPESFVRHPCLDGFLARQETHGLGFVWQL